MGFCHEKTPQKDRTCVIKTMLVGVWPLLSFFFGRRRLKEFLLFHWSIYIYIYLYTHIIYIYNHIYIYTYTYDNVISVCGLLYPAKTHKHIGISADIDQKLIVGSWLFLRFLYYQLWLGNDQKIHMGNPRLSSGCGSLTWTAMGGSINGGTPKNGWFL